MKILSLVVECNGYAGYLTIEVPDDYVVKEFELADIVENVTWSEYTLENAE